VPFKRILPVEIKRVFVKLTEIKAAVKERKTV
jgi:hypothetical protein